MRSVSHCCRRRRRATVKDHAYRYEFVDPEWDVDDGPDAPLGEQYVAPTTASDAGAGPLGFAGTARKDTLVDAAGMVTLAGDEFGSGPALPMMPGTWRHEQDEEAVEDS
jgi:PPE-repeat protein